jgi:hypothetical protein
MKTRKSVTALLLVAMVLSSAIVMSGCATKRQLADLETKVDQALNEARSAKAAAADATAQVQRAEAAADRAEKAALSADNAAKRAEAMANKSEAVFMQKMKK